MQIQSIRWFQDQLRDWHFFKNTREMPWKGEKNPYKIWLSEIILQQTHAVQGITYYQKFINHYPTVFHLAHASEEQVFKLWEGLGYYSRCRNLIKAARIIVEKQGGFFPASYEKLLSLPGIGDYTASAIASFAFDLPYAVLDGNVFRLLSRYFGIQQPIDTTAGKNLFKKLSGELLDQSQPALYNQAIMDFGAIICKPRNPLCEECPLQSNCEAYRKDMVQQLPVKVNKLLKKHRFFNSIIFRYKNQILIKKRGTGDVWQDLYQFVLYESSASYGIKDFRQTVEDLGIPFNKKQKPMLLKQILTHQVIHGTFLQVNLSKKIDIAGYKWIDLENLSQYPFPSIIVKYNKYVLLEPVE